MDASTREVKRLKRVFGIVYFVQGSSSLPDLSIFYFMMNVLKLGPVEGQIFRGLRHLPWFIKPLWGWISDRFSLFGYHRKSYFIFMACTAFFSWGAVGLCAWFGFTSAILYLLFLNTAQLAYAFVDVVTDAVMVEKGQTLNSIGRFVNFQWTMLAVALVIVSLTGGWFQGLIEAGRLSYTAVFIMTGFFPLMTAVVGCLNFDETRRRVPASPSADPGPGPSSVGFRERLEGLRIRVANCRTFLSREKHIFLLMLFIIAWHFSPSAGYAAQTYWVKELQFTPAIFGILRALSSVIWIVSIIFYRWFARRFRSVPWDRYLYAMVALGLVSLAAGYYFYLPPDHLLSVTIPFPWDTLTGWTGSLQGTWLGWVHTAAHELAGWNRYHWWALITEATLGFASIPAFLIPLTLAGEAASKQHAGFIYALLMSVTNFTNSIEDLAGGLIYKLFSVSWMEWFITAFRKSVFNISGTSDVMLLILQIFVYISVLFTLIGIPFIYWVKKEFDRRKLEVHLA